MTFLLGFAKFYECTRMVTPTDTLPKNLRPDFPPHLHGFFREFPKSTQKTSLLGPAEIFLQGQSVDSMPEWNPAILPF